MDESKEKAIIFSFGDLKKYVKLVLNWKVKDIQPPSRSEYIQYMSNDNVEYEEVYDKYCKEPSIIENTSKTNPSTSSTQQPVYALDEAPLTQLQRYTQKEEEIQLLPVSINETPTVNTSAPSTLPTQLPQSAHNENEIIKSPAPLTQLQEYTQKERDKVSNQEDRQEDNMNALMEQDLLHNKDKTAVGQQKDTQISSSTTEKEKVSNQEDNKQEDNINAFLMDQDLSNTEDETVDQRKDTPTTSSSTKLSKYNKSQLSYHDTPMDGFIRIFIFNVNEIPKLNPKIKKGLPVTTKDIHVGWRDVKFCQGKLEVNGYITLPSVPRQITKKSQKICGVLKCTITNFSSESKYLQHIQDVHYKNILNVFCPHPDCIESNAVFQNFGLFYQHSKKEHQIQNKIMTMALELYSKVQFSRKKDDKRTSRGSGKSKKQIDQNQNQQRQTTPNYKRKSTRIISSTFKAKEAAQESKTKTKLNKLDEYEKMCNAYEQLKLKYEELKEENQILRNFKTNENKDEFLATIIQDLTEYGFQVCSLASKLEILRNAKNSN